MRYELAHLTEEQRRLINDLEAKAGVVLIAYQGYQQETEEGVPIDQKDI